MSKPKAILLFALAIAVQLAILAAIPARRVMARSSGTTVTLKMRPVDPYDILSGYHMVIRYDISNLKETDGWDDAPLGGHIYVVLIEDLQGDWNAVSVHEDMPEDPPAGAVIIKGWRDYSSVKYGIENFYIPEENRHEIEDDLRGNIDKARAEVAVGADGTAALLRLRVGDRVYDY